MAMALKLTVPVVSDFVLSEGPSIWSFFLTWLTPPYLYILLNCIILTIIVSSKLHHHQPRSPPPHTPLLSTDPVIITGDIAPDYAAYDGPNPVVLPPVQSPATEPVKIFGGVQTDYNAYNGVVSEGYVCDANVPAKSDDAIMNGYGKAILAPTSLQRKDSIDFAFSNENEKPPVSARFGHRKAVKASPEGGKGALGVAKPKRQETLETTWRTITEGRAMPLKRHLKKSDTWDSQTRRTAAALTDQYGGTPPNPKGMKKSETFSGGRENSPSPSPGSAGRLRKEPSLSQDELNRRVEAFINKFNQEMRLQRQESLRQYREMMSRGAR